MTDAEILSSPEYSTPGTSRGLLSVVKYRYLLSLLIRKGVLTRYYGSVLGWVWSYIRPLAQFSMYYLVIGVLLGANRGMEFFPVYLFSGIIMVNLFNETLRNSTDAVVSNKALISKIFMPRELFSVAATAGAVIHFLPQAAVLLVICLVLGWTITWMQVAAFLGAVVLITVFALGLGLLFGAINALYRDAKNLVDIILLFSTWASPVLYTAQLVQDKAPTWLYNLYMLNPVTVGVELSHEAFWAPIEPGGFRPDGLLFNVGIGFGIALLVLLVGQIVFHKLEARFAQSL